jgi:hypothetical protein
MFARLRGDVAGVAAFLAASRLSPQMQAQDALLAVAEQQPSWYLVAWLL